MTASVDPAGRPKTMRFLYVGVLAVEAAVLLAIWLFQTYFGS